MSDPKMTIGEEILQKLDEVRHLLSIEEGMLVDAYIKANNDLHNAGQMIELDALGTAKNICQSGGPQRQSYLLAFIEAKKRQQ